MNNFISNLLFRHVEAGNNIKPRIRSLFEPVTNFPGIYPGAALTGQDIAGENLLNFPRQEQNHFNSQSAESPNTSPDQNLNSFPGTSNENDMVNKDFLKSSFLHPRDKEDNKLFHFEKEKAFNQIKSTPIVQPGGGATTLGTAAPVRRQSETTTREEDLLHTNNENGTAGFFKEHHSTKENVSAINPISYSAETIKPVLKKYGAEGSESQGRGNSFSGLLNQYRQLPTDKRTTGLNGNETNRPVIKVTIGRIDVRAVVQSTPSPVRSTAMVKPKLSLEDYLKQRNHTPS